MIWEFVRNNLPISTILKGLNVNNRRCNLRKASKMASQLRRS